MFNVKGVDQLAELGLGVPRFVRSRPAARDTKGHHVAGSRLTRFSSTLLHSRFLCSSSFSLSSFVLDPMTTTSTRTTTISNLTRWFQKSLMPVWILYLCSSGLVARRNVAAALQALSYSRQHSHE